MQTDVPFMHVAFHSVHMYLCPERLQIFVNIRDNAVTASFCFFVFFHWLDWLDFC